MSFIWLQGILRQKLALPGDSEDLLELKVLLVIFTMFVLPPVMGMTALCYMLDMPVLKQFGWIIIGFYSISLAAFFRVKKYVGTFFYFNQIGMLFITMVTAARLGGILTAGGILYAALAIPVFTFVYPHPRLPIITSVLYIIGILILTVAQPWLITAPEMLKPGVNLMFTTLNAVWISIYILLVIFQVFDKRIRDERAKKQRLLELDELKTRLYTNITHEFRTPLTLILGAAAPASLSTGISHPLPLEGRGGRLDLIRRNANRLLRLVNQMLNLARLESGAMPVHKVRGNILPVLVYFIDSFRSMAERRKVRLHFLCSLAELDMDYDPEKMEDIISNLLSNAIKFTPPEGDVYLSTEILKNNNGTRYFSLKVRDTGIGIPADKLSFIFDRFFQIDPEHTHVEEGSGIGLTLVKEYVRLLGGEISVQSTQGKGTEFTLLLPLTQAALRVAAPLSGLLPAGATAFDDVTPERQAEGTAFDSNLPVLLLVEDNGELRHFLQSILAGQYKVISARNGEEGIERALEIVPDVIVSDVMMPVKDGFELCRTLKNDFRTSHIPIILLTARADADSKMLGLERGADAYMPKPFQAKELLLRLRKLIELREKLRIKYQVNGHLADAAQPRGGAGLDELFMRELLQNLENNYTDEQFGIEALCAAMNISRIQLHRKLVALNGVSASHFINRFRLEKAAEQLRSSRKTVSEIAFEVGFHDANYFTKVFTKAFNASPSEWRHGGNEPKVQ